MRLVALAALIATAVTFMSSDSYSCACEEDAETCSISLVNSTLDSFDLLAHQSSYNVPRGGTASFVLKRTDPEYRAELSRDTGVVAILTCQYYPKQNPEPASSCTVTLTENPAGVFHVSDNSDLVEAAITQPH